MLAISVNSAQLESATDSAEDTYVVVRPESPGNVWGFWTEAAALAAIRDQLACGEAATITSWSLVRVPADPVAEWQTIAEGEDLLTLAAAPGPSAA